MDWFIGKTRRKEKEGADSSACSDSKLYLEATVLERKLPEMDMKILVDLPAGLDYNEWLASHTMSLFDHVNLVYGAISEFCTTSSCPDMTGPGQSPQPNEHFRNKKYKIISCVNGDIVLTRTRGTPCMRRTYLWFDEKGKKTKVAAPQYVDYVMTFIQKTVSDETIFPTKYANEFPVSFESIVRKIVRLLYHVVAHLYAAHFKEVVLLGLHSHLNQTFVHLMALHHRFSLIDPKETDILEDLEVALGLNQDTLETANNNENKEEPDTSEEIRSQSTDDICGDNKS